MPSEGVLVQSSSDLIGVAGAGNIISKNAWDGVQLDQGATQVQIAANYIGEAPGGGFVLGNPNPGNGADGVDIIGAANNTVGGSSAADGNSIASNAGDGVEISGATATGNVVSYNMIGVTADGSQALGNGDDGVVIDVVADPGRAGERHLGQRGRRRHLGLDDHGDHRDRQPDRHRRHGRVRPGQCLPGRASSPGRPASRSRAMARARRSSRATTWGSSSRTRPRAP